jgi:hypothetical protein
MISGLAGGPLVLQNNGGDDLPISANGAFTFNSPLTSGPYLVTIKPGGMPTGLGQACTISNGSGTIGSIDITGVRVRCSITLTGSGFSIPDAPTGSCGSGTAGPSQNSTVSIDGGYFSVGAVTVRIIGFKHPWVGDLIGSITHVSTGSTVTLFNKTACSYLHANGTYAFHDDAGSLCTLVGQYQDAGTVVLPPGGYAGCVAGAPKYLSQPSPNGFATESVSGDWTFAMIDDGSGDVGSISGWSITLEPP